MDIFEAGRMFAGDKPRKEGAATTRPNNPSNAASSIVGIALSDSYDGKVAVDIDGTPHEELPNEGTPIKEGDQVSIRVVGNRMVVTGVIGSGDRLQQEVTEAAQRYSVESNVVAIEYYPDGSSVPSEITFSSWERIGAKGVKTPYSGSMKVELSIDGETWQTFQVVEASSFTVPVSALEADLEGFTQVRVVLSTTDDAPEEVAEIMISKSDQMAQVLTVNDSGLYMHRIPGDENYDKGYYTRLFDSALEMGKDGVALARYAASKLELGLSDEAIIEMCNGALNIKVDSSGSPFIISNRSLKIQDNGSLEGTQPRGLIELMSLGAPTSPEGTILHSAMFRIGWGRGIGLWPGLWKDPINGDAAVRISGRILPQMSIRKLQRTDNLSKSAGWVNSIPMQIDQFSTWLSSQKNIDREDVYDQDNVDCIEIKKAGFYELCAGARISIEQIPWACAISLWDTTSGTRYCEQTTEITTSGQFASSKKEICYVAAGAKIYLAVSTPHTATIFGSTETFIEAKLVGYNDDVVL